MVLTALNSLALLHCDLHDVIARVKSGRCDASDSFRIASLTRWAATWAYIGWHAQPEIAKLGCHRVLRHGDS